VADEDLEAECRAIAFLYCKPKECCDDLQLDFCH
jgi:hypothetical protein